VRVIRMGGKDVKDAARFSLELCGGTHAGATG
jgi:alanyl-tRNA synthetase